MPVVAVPVVVPRYPRAPRTAHLGAFQIQTAKQARARLIFYLGPSSTTRMAAQELFPR
jgi:hypothetical protein